MQLRELARRTRDQRGLWRLSEFLRKRYASERRTILIEDFDGDLMFHCALDEHMGSQIFWRGGYSTDQLALLGRLLTPEMVFIDVGANQGEFSLFAAKRLSAGRVFAFEPVSDLFQQLERNVKANGFGNVELINKGLSDRAGRFTVHAPARRYEDGTRHEGLYTLYPTERRNRIHETIELIRLDHFVQERHLQRVDVMKLDIEGAELAALQGAYETVTGFRPILIMEVNEETSQAAGYPARRLLDWLAALNYRFDLITYPGGRLLPVEPEFLTDIQNVVCWPLA